MVDAPDTASDVHLQDKFNSDSATLFRQLVGEIALIKNRLTTIEAAIVAIEAMIADMEPRIETLEADYISLDARVTALENAPEPD